MAKHDSVTKQHKDKQQNSAQTSIARRESSFPSPLSVSPFTFMRRFGEEMDRLFDDFGFGNRRFMPSRTSDRFLTSLEGLGRNWEPQVEVFERDGQLTVRADLPGMTKDDIKVEVTDEAINISGERNSEHEEKREGYYRTERSYGSFYRSIPLPEGVSADQANASVRNGVLEITMPISQQQSRGRRLEIRDASEVGAQAKAQAGGR
jgi:HSP20 family protein